MTVREGYLFADTSRSGMYPLKDMSSDGADLGGDEGNAALFDVITR